MKIQALISTMDNKDIISLVKKMNVNIEAIVVNQSEVDYKEVYEVNEIKILECSSKERGLSKSRNMAIENSDADICVISDDDFIYRENAFKYIVESYNKISDADIILFRYIGDSKKNFANKIRKINLITSLKACSAQITFKRKSIEDIRFDERFGSGSNVFISGEENIFLADCLRHGLKIYYVPIDILQLENKRDSTWFKGFDEKYFETRGACFYRINKIIYSFLIFQFAIRKYKLYKDKINFKNAITYMQNGKKKLKRLE